MNKKLILIVEDSEESYDYLREEILEDSKYKDEIEIDWAQSSDEARDFIDDNDKNYYMFILDRNIPKENEGSPESNYSMQLLMFLRDHPVYGGDNKDPNWLIYSAERETIYSLLNDDNFYIDKSQTYLKGEEDFINRFDPLFNKGSDKNKIFKETIGASYKTIGNLLGQNGRKKMLRVAQVIVDNKKENIDLALQAIRNIRNTLANTHRKKTGLTKEKFFVKKKLEYQEPEEKNIINQYDGELNYLNYLHYLFLEEKVIDEKFNYILYGLNKILSTYGAHEGESRKEIPLWVDINMVRVCFHAVAVLAEILYDDHKRRERERSQVS